MRADAFYFNSRSWTLTTGTAHTLLRADAWFAGTISTGASLDFTPAAQEVWSFHHAEAGLDVEMLPAADGVTARVSYVTWDVYELVGDAAGRVRVENLASSPAIGAAVSFSISSGAVDAAGPVAADEDGRASTGYRTPVAAQVSAAVTFGGLGGSGTLAVAANALRITTAELPAGVVGANYTAVLAAAGGAGLPAGYQLFSNGTLGGTGDSSSGSQQAGTYTFTAEVTDSAGQSASRLMTLVLGNPVITPPGGPPPDGPESPPGTFRITNTTLGVAYEEYSFAASILVENGVANSYTASGLPAGLAIDSLTGRISGAPAWGTARETPYTVNLIATSDELLTSAYKTVALQVVKRVQEADGDGSHSQTPSVDIVPDDGMKGVIGDEVKSSKQDSTIKHFVTPKAAPSVEGPPEPINQPYVVLKAVGVTAEQITRGHANQIFEWDTTVGESFPGDPLKWCVRRDAANKYEVKIKAKQGGAVAAQMDVWVVWAELDQGMPKALSTFAAKTSGTNCVPTAASVVFVYNIQPIELIVGLKAGRDVPKLDGIAQSLPISVPENTNDIDTDSAVRRWDVTRALRVKIKNPTNPPTIVASDLAANLGIGNAIRAKSSAFPHAEVEIKNFPIDKWRGNDDPTSLVGEDNNPYDDQESFVDKNVESSDPRPQIGQIASYDCPRAPRACY